MLAVPHASDAFIVESIDPPRDLVLTVPNGRSGSAVAFASAYRAHAQLDACELERLGSALIRQLSFAAWNY
jgi:hypothetical protein